jgi:hypothetical protein
MDESMFPALPADLSALDDSELDALRAEYLAVVRQVRAGDETTIGERSAEEVIAELTAGVEALEQIKSEITTRAEAEQNFSQSLEELATRAGVTEDETPEPEATEELAAETEAEEAAQPEAVAAAAKPIRRPLPERNRRHRARESAEFSNQPVLRASNLLSGIVDPGTPLDSKSLGKVLADVVKTNRAPNGLKLVGRVGRLPVPGGSAARALVAGRERREDLGRHQPARADRVRRAVRAADAYLRPAGRRVRRPPRPRGARELPGDPRRRAGARQPDDRRLRRRGRRRHRGERRARRHECRQVVHADRLPRLRRGDGRLHLLLHRGREPDRPAPIRS